MSGYAFAGTGLSGHEKTATNLALSNFVNSPPARLSVGGRTYGMASGHFRCEVDLGGSQLLREY